LTYTSKQIYLDYVNLVSGKSQEYIYVDYVSNEIIFELAAEN